MTNIEQLKDNDITIQFFKTFGIEPECSIEDVKNVKCVEKKCKDCIFYMKPEITAEILLELICILNDFEGINVKATTIEELKEELLKQCIEPFEYPIAFEEHHEIDKLYHQVRALFGEEEE